MTRDDQILLAALLGGCVLAFLVPIVYVWFATDDR